MLWLVWVVFLALLGLEFALPSIVPRRPREWYPAQTAVAGFVAALLSMLAAVGTFVVRESLVLRDVRGGALDPASPTGFARLQTMLLTLWAMCLLIGAFGSLLAYGAAVSAAAWPYIVAAAVLLAIHAPRRWLFTKPTSS
jgi:hypothetical protein